MSYKLNILSGNPISYYTLNGTLYDELNSSASIYGSNYSFLSPPIITNSGSALKFGYLGSLYFPNNNLEALSKNFEDKTFTVAFWFSLNNQLTGSGYGTNPVNLYDNKLNLFHVNSTVPQIFTVYYDYISNTIRLKVVGSNNTEAYIPLRNMNTAYYVVATYSNKKLSIVVNGETGISGYVYDTSMFSPYSKDNLYYSMYTTMEGTGAIKHYLISDIAMYNRQLNIQEINQHLSWAFNDNKPISYSKSSGDISFANIQASNNSFHYAKTISGKNFKDQGIYYNLNIDNFGISPKKIDRVSVKNYSGTSSISFDSTYGVSWTGSAGIYFNNIYPQFDLSSFMINLQIKRPSIQNENIFSIENLSDNSFIYLNSSSLGYSLNYYNPITSSSFVIISLATAPNTSGIKDISVGFNRGSVYLYASDSGYATGSSDTLKKIKFKNSTNIVIGNYARSVKSFVSSIKNFGITEKVDFAVNINDWSKPITFMAKFTNTNDPYVVSQYGSWQTIIPITRNGNSFISQIDWNTMDNCIVSTSIDNSSTFNIIKKNSPIHMYSSLQNPKPSTLKVELYTDYYVESKTQSFNNLSISVVDQINIQTDLNNYQLTPVLSSSATSPSFKNDSIPIISNPPNLGIKFTGASAQPPAYLYASTQFGTHSALDFWYRNDNLSGSAIMISSDQGLGKEPYIYVSSAGYIVSNASSLYVNGQLTNSGSFAVSVGTPYHIAIIPTASITASAFYINGHPTTASANTSCATYGMINIWNSVPTASVISSIYNSYLGRTTQIIIDDNTTKIVPNVSNDSIFAYKIG